MIWIFLDISRAVGFQWSVQNANFDSIIGEIRCLYRKVENIHFLMRKHYSISHKSACQFHTTKNKNEFMNVPELVNWKLKCQVRQPGAQECKVECNTATHNLHQKWESNLILNLETKERIEKVNKFGNSCGELRMPFHSLKHLKPIVASIKWRIEQPRILGALYFVDRPV